jgi:hypothetical protein
MVLYAVFLVMSVFEDIRKLYLEKVKKEKEHIYVAFSQFVVCANKKGMLETAVALMDNAIMEAAEKKLNTEKEHMNAVFDQFKASMMKEGMFEIGLELLNKAKNDVKISELNEAKALANISDLMPRMPR